MSDLSNTEISSLRALGHAVRLFKDLTDAPIPAAGISIFCAIASREGHSIESHRKLVGLNFNQAGKIIQDLSERNRYGSQGLGLVEKRVGDNHREMACYLTPKGKAFAKRVAGALMPKLGAAA